MSHGGEATIAGAKKQPEPAVRIKTRTAKADPPRPQGPPPSAENVARSLLLRQTGKRKP